MPILGRKRNVFLAELGKQYSHIENKGYDNASLKKEKDVEEKIVKTFNAGNPDGNNLKAI